MVSRRIRRFAPRKDIAAAAHASAAFPRLSMLDMEVDG